MTTWSLHPGEALSSLVDGELDALDAAEVRAHVVSCAECGTELEAIRAARAAVRALPAVSPPPDFLEGLLTSGLPPDIELTPGHRARVVPLGTARAALGNVAAAAVVAVLLLGVLGDGAATVVPEVGGAVRRHASTVSAVSSDLGGGEPFFPSGGVTATTAAPRSTDEIGAPFVAPHRLAGYELVAAYRVPHGVHLLYERGRFGLSVFEEVGALDLDDLPVQGRRLDVDGLRGWRWEHPTADGRVLVVERGDLVVTLVGDESEDAVLAAARALPASSAPGLGTRLRRAAADALDGLRPTG